MRRAALVALVVVALGLSAPAALAQPALRIVFPHDGGAVFSLPKVLLIFQLEDPGELIMPDHIEVLLDGKPVPHEAIAGCAVCGGQNPGILPWQVPWAITDGEHEGIVRVTFRDGHTISARVHYTMDTTVPTTAGLSGFVTVPSARVAAAASIRAGVTVDMRVGATLQGWGVATRLLKSEEGVWWARPFEFGATAILPSGDAPNDVEPTWKVSLREPHGAGWHLAVGETTGSPYAVASYAPQPVVWEAAVGIGNGDQVPDAWAAFLYGPQLFRLMAEAGTNGHYAAGLVLSHPYGVRLAVYWIADDRQWTGIRAQLSASLAF